MQAYVALPTLVPNIVKLKQHFLPQSRAEPHITLVPPDELMVSKQRAVKEFQKIRPRQLVLKTAGIEVFSKGLGGIVYVAFEPNPVLEHLQKELINKLSGKVIADLKHNQQFVPHVTVARAKSPRRLAEIADSIELKKLYFRFRPSPVSLMGRDSEHDDWRLLAALT